MLSHFIAVVGLCAPLISAADAAADSTDYGPGGWGGGGGPGGWGGGGGGYGYGGGKPGGGAPWGGPGGWGGPFGGGGWGGAPPGGPPGGGWGAAPPGAPAPAPAPTSGLGSGPQLPSCFMQTWKDSGISGMSDFKQLCASAAKPGFLVKVAQDLCGKCSSDKGAIAFAGNMLPMLQSQCTGYGMAVPGDIFTAATEAAKCGPTATAAPPPAPPGPTGPAGPPGPSGPPGPPGAPVTQISTMTIRSTLYPNVTSPFGTPPSAVVTTYTTTSTPAGFTQAGLTTTTPARSSSSIVPFTGAASSIALEWWLTVTPIVAAVFWTFA